MGGWRVGQRVSGEECTERMRAPFERTQTRSRGRGVGPVTVLLIDCIPTASGGQSAAFFLLFPYLLTSPKDISSAAIFAGHRACARRFPFFLLSLFSCTLVLWPPLTFYGSVVYDCLRARSKVFFLPNTTISETLRRLPMPRCSRGFSLASRRNSARA